MQNGHLGRRQFLQHSALGVAGAAAAAGTAMGADSTAKPASEETASPDVSTKVDVLVVGGGTAGTIAAIQAARVGAKTLIVERNSQLGGTMTTGGVAFPGLFDAWGKQIIAGIGWELVKESVELDGGTLPDLSKVPKRHWMNQIKVNQYLYSILAEEKCEQAGVEIAYYEFPQTVRKTDSGWQVGCVGFGTRRVVDCRQVIDCTGGAEVVGLMGYERLRGSRTQPGSFLYQLQSNYNTGRVGVLPCHYMDHVDPTNSRTVTAANLKGRKAVLGMVRRSKKRLTHLQPETAFRESYRILGETVVTEADYASGRVFEDAVAYAFYPVDLHKGTGFELVYHLKPGVIPTIPLGALIPKNSRNVMVAGRCISSDRPANGGLRVQASCMAMGQAAGVTAALAVAEDTTPLKVPLKDIREMLGQHGAIVPTV